MGEHVLFLTGRLAYPSLCRELDAMEAKDFTYTVHELGLSVAALMTADMVRRRLDDPMGADRIVVPGLCGGPVESLEATFGVPVERGPKDLRDLPEHFGKPRAAQCLDRHAVTLFAEIVDAPRLDVSDILARAEAYRTDGADVVDLGFLPGEPFPHLEDAVAALHERGFRVSADSLDPDDLVRAGRAGADYLLSLNEATLWIAHESAATPVLIPASDGDLDSLCRAVEQLDASGRDYLADPILAPLHCGFTDSVVRYHELRRRMPQVAIMVGTGNVTELTDGDTTGITALLMGVVSELGASAILTTQVSPHARTAVREADLARRVMYAAREAGTMPRGIHRGLMALRDRKPFPYSPAEIAALADAVRDPSFRIQVSEAGIHVYNRDGIQVAVDPFELFPGLDVREDGPHAFYLGVELARAQIAWQLGKRYMQDQPLAWGCVVPEQAPGEGYAPPGSTLKADKDP